MRKAIIIILVTLFVVTLIGASTYAWKGGGFGGYGGNCPVYGSVASEKTQRFYNDTLPLRQKQLQLRGELMQLYAQPNPDWNAIIQKRQEMAKIMTEFQKKAYEYGFPYGYGRMHGFGNYPNSNLSFAQRGMVSKHSTVGNPSKTQKGCNDTLQLRQKQQNRQQERLETQTREQERVHTKDRK